ncbi:hypothetical protein ACWF5H_01395 [Arthrobacter sp. NPDC055138]
MSEAPSRSEAVPGPHRGTGPGARPGAAVHSNIMDQGKVLP